MFVCLPTNGIWKKSLLTGHSFCDGLQAGTSKTSSILVVSPLDVSLMIDQVEDLRTEGGKVTTSIITSGSDLVKPLLAAETSLCTDSVLFCAPEALALTLYGLCAQLLHV